MIRKFLQCTAMASVVMATSAHADNPATPGGNLPTIVPPVSDDYRRGIRKRVAPDRGPDWAGHEIGVKPGRKWYRGKIPVQPGGKTYHPIAPEGADRATLGAGVTSVVIYDPADHSLYEHELPSEGHEALIEVLERRGYQEGSMPEAPDIVLESKEELIEKEWGGNTDNRSVRTGTTYERIGQMTSGCTGTFIGGPQPAGEYFIITAAHCLFNAAGAYVDPNFIPARNGSTQPFGVWDGWQWMMPSFFSNNCRGQGSGGTAISNDCIANDIAVVRVGRPSGQGYPGAMGFGYWNNSTLNSTAKYHRGYAGCGAGAPSVGTCGQQLFGDGAFGSVTSFSPTSSGWDRILRHDSDLNGGHSGGPLYRYDNGQKVFGVQSAHVSTCYGSTTGTGCPPSTRPNRARRIEPTFYGWILDFMASF